MDMNIRGSQNRGLDCVENDLIDKGGECFDDEWKGQIHRGRGLGENLPEWW